MTGVVLAAGRGSRLRPLTDELPKPLIPLPDGTRLIDRAIRPLLGFCERIVVVAGYKGEAIRDYLSQRYPDVFCTMVPKVVKGNLLSLMMAKEYVVEGPMVVTNADHVFGQSIVDFIATAHEGVAIACQSVMSRRVGTDEMKVVVTPDGRLKNISKALEGYDGAYVGIFRVSAESTEVFWDYAIRLYSSDNAEARVVEDVFLEMIKDGVPPQVVWIDKVRFYEVDTPQDLEVLKGAVQGGGI